MKSVRWALLPCMLSWVILLPGLSGETPSIAPDIPSGINDVRQGFANPPDNSRFMVRWWWFGAAVTKPELEREIKAMKAAGIGGFEVAPVYPMTLDDPQRSILNLPYLSPGFLDALLLNSGKVLRKALKQLLPCGFFNQFH